MKSLRTARSAAVVTAIALAVALAGCSGGAMAGASALQQPSTRNRVTPNSCELSIYIVPRSAVITANQVQLLSAYQHFPFQSLCYTGPIKATWSSTGGNLDVISSGEQADFSASQTGSYTITASAVINHRFLQATAAVTVVKMVARGADSARPSYAFAF